MTIQRDQERTLTDADVKALVDYAIEQFYSTVGKSFMKLVWAGVFVIMLGLAYYGMKVK